MRKVRVLPAAFVWACLIHAAPPPIPLPSRWQGEAAGQIRNRTFRLPVHIEIGKALPEDRNPFWFLIGTEPAGRGQPARVGEFLLMSAQQAQTTSGAVTLRYFTVETAGGETKALLTDTQARSAMTANLFTAPNLSADEGSPILRDIREALGTTLEYAFRKGAVVKLRMAGGSLSGTVEGEGFSVAGPGPDLRFACSLTAKRVP